MRSILVAMMKTVLMQSLDVLRLQRDRRIAPTEVVIRMMAFNFGEFTNLLNKGRCLPEVVKPKAPLDAVSVLQQLPVRGLCVKELSLLARERRYSPATGSPGFASKSFGDVACSSRKPPPAPRLANCERHGPTMDREPQRSRKRGDRPAPPRRDKINRKAARVSVEAAPRVVQRCCPAHRGCRRKGRKRKGRNLGAGWCKRGPAVIGKLQGVDDIPPEREPCQPWDSASLYYLIAQKQPPTGLWREGSGKALGPLLF